MYTCVHVYEHIYTYFLPLIARTASMPALLVHMLDRTQKACCDDVHMDTYVHVHTYVHIHTYYRHRRLAAMMCICIRTYMYTYALAIDTEGLLR